MDCRGLPFLPKGGAAMTPHLLARAECAGFQPDGPRRAGSPRKGKDNER